MAAWAVLLRDSRSGERFSRTTKMAKKKNLSPDERRQLAAMLTDIQRDVRALTEQLQARAEKRPT